MDGTGFLKTVSFGGFDKKDVLAYVDKLNTQIYTLENELNEAKKLAEVSGDDSETKAKYEELLKSDRAKIAELQASNDSAKNQINVGQETVRVVPWANVELIHWLTERTDWNAEIGFDTKGSLILQDLARTMIAERRDGFN